MGSKSKRKCESMSLVFVLLMVSGHIQQFLRGKSPVLIFFWAAHHHRFENCDSAIMSGEGGGLETGTGVIMLLKLSLCDFSLLSGI